MDLKDKLKYYQSGTQKSVQDTSHRLDELVSRIGGIVIEGDTLPIIKIVKKIPYRFVDPAILEKAPSSIHIPLLTKKIFPDPVDIKDILVFDLETTGLAGGTGTYPFLIGFGVFEDNHLETIQYFLPDFGREISAYLDVKELWAEKKTLLTYNGKSYDYPLLRNRLILNRVDNPIQNYSHIDLLHSTRRLWKNALPSCSLGTIEERIFCFNRWKDIDGSLIPNAYFTYVQAGDYGDIIRIIDHNQQDIISLARLLFFMNQLENAGSHNPYPNRDLVSLFNVAVRTSDLERIEPMFESFSNDKNLLPAYSLKKYSLLLKRKKKWEQALNIWENFLIQGEEILFACEEIAKYYEHRDVNLSHALDYTNRALEFINIIGEIKDEKGIQHIQDNFNRRLIRIQKKLNKK